MNRTQPNDPRREQPVEPAAAPEQAAEPAAVAAEPPAAAVPAEPAEPAALPLMAEDGAFTPDWYSRFEELRPYAATLAKFRRPEALAKSYAHLERLKGYPDTADAARMAAFRSAVGLPATAEEYELPRPADTPDAVWNPELAACLGRVAYEYGVPPRAMEALSARYAEEGRRWVQQQAARETAAVQEADAALQDEWGPQYEANMEEIGTFLGRLADRAGVDAAPLLQSPALRANADFAKLMLEAAQQLQEAPLHEGKATDSRAEAHRMAHDPTHPLYEAYMRTSHPQHRYANEQYDRLAFGKA